MINPFMEDEKDDLVDQSLVKSVTDGDQESLETLIKRHQGWVYNIALRMFRDADDAEDATQDILIKMMTKLSTYQGKSAFRTWLYRIVKNHILNMKKGYREAMNKGFKQFAKNLDNAIEQDLPDDKSLPVEKAVLVEETKIGCLTAMLLCLDREQRLIFIFSEIFEVSDTLGSQIFEMTKDNFRKKLSRARKQLVNFIQKKCGLINQENSCRCEKKTKAFMDAGYVDPDNRIFTNNYIHKVKELSRQRSKTLEPMFDKEYTALYREHPFQSPPNYVELLRKVMNNSDFKRTFDL